MDVAIGVLLGLSVTMFFLGFGVAIGSGGEDTQIAVVSTCVALACMMWFWGYFCGKPAAETEEEEGG